MTKRVSAIPKGYRSVTPTLVVNGLLKALEFYEQAFNAEVINVKHNPVTYSPIHAEIKIGNSNIKLFEQNPSLGLVAPTGESTSTSLQIYSENIQQSWDNSLAAGAQALLAMDAQYWGERLGVLRDPLGHTWVLSEKIENLKPAELEAREAKLFADPTL